MKNKNQIGGKKAQHIGKIFEKYIESTCIRYRTKGIADIKKTPEPMRPVGVINKRMGWFKAIYEKKGQPDFLGTLKGGRSVMMETKHTDKKLMPFDRIPPHQEYQLKSTMQFGGLSLVLLSFELKRFYCIEWSEWVELKESVGKKSVNEKDLAPYEVKFQNGIIDFLEKYRKR